MTLRDQIQAEEGKRLTPYRDQYGWLTIGYGRNLDASGISEDEAELMLDNDLARYSAAVHIRLPWSDSMDEVRKAVLIGLAMNMGTGGLMGFHVMLQACQDQRWEDAAVALLDSRYAQQLPERAHRYAAQLRTGVWA